MSSLRSCVCGMATGSRASHAIAPVTTRIETLANGSGGWLWDAVAMAITRMWRGWTTPAAAADYERFLLDDLFPSLRGLDGFLGADVLTCPDGPEMAFVTLTRFRSLDDVRAFAGDSLETPVIDPRAEELLARYEERVQHFQTSTFAI